MGLKDWEKSKLQEPNQNQTVLIVGFLIDRLDNLSMAVAQMTAQAELLIKLKQEGRIK